MRENIHPAIHRNVYAGVILRVSKDQLVVTVSFGGDSSDQLQTHY